MKTKYIKNFLGPRAAKKNIPWWSYFGFVILYVTLDATSFVHPMYGLNITLWNPQPALCVAFAMRWGWRVLPPMIVSVITAELFVRGFHQPPLLTLSIALSLALIYYTTGLALGKKLNGRVVFGTHRELLIWLKTISIGVSISGICVIYFFYLFDLLTFEDLPHAFMRYHIGDMIGVVLFLPLNDCFTNPSHLNKFKAYILRSDGFACILSAILSLQIVFGHGADDEFKYLYVFFIPVIWASIRGGLVGAVVVATILQFGIISCGRVLGYGPITVLEMQIFMFTLAMVGFFIGVIVDELLKLNFELQHTMRLAAAGEMAGALAHELNQPLTALVAYGRSAEILMQNNDYGPLLCKTVSHLQEEANRAADIISRLRDFFRSGATKIEMVNLDQLVQDVHKRSLERIHRNNITCTFDIPKNLNIPADRLQLDVVLRNLFTNAIEAVEQNTGKDKQIFVSAKPADNDSVLVRVVDNGPGVGTMADRVFEPFATSKGSGMGLGLAISKAIAETHGGTIWFEDCDHGEFNLRLPLNAGDENIEE